VRWTDASTFEVGKRPVSPVISETAPGLPVIYDNARRAGTRAGKLHTTFTGWNSSLPDNYSLLPESLARLMTAMAGTRTGKLKH
jgi:hypothetical protein